MRSRLFGSVPAGFAVFLLAIAFPISIALASDEVPGVGGLTPTTAAKPGLSLPSESSRVIEFETSEGTDLQLDLSPDGTTIVFALLGDIYTMPSAGGIAQRITEGMAIDSQPVFSPDGNWLAFLSDRSGAENVWVMHPDGSNARQIGLYDDDPIFVSPSWTPDGSGIYVSRFWPDRNAYDLWHFTVDRAGLGTVAIPNGTAEGDVRHTLGAVVSPDGNWLYHASRTGSLDLAEPVEWQIVRTGLSDRSREVVVTASGDARLGKSQTSSFRPTISHNGKLLAFIERRAGQTWLRLLDLASHQFHDLVRLDPDSLQASYWSDIAPRVAFTPDDRGIVFTSGGKLRRIRLSDDMISEVRFTTNVRAHLAPLARAPTRIETGPVELRLIQDPQLSPDGAMFAFSALGRLYLMPVGGGDPVPIATDGPPRFHPYWSSDGLRLLSVSWTNEEGGHVWETDISSGNSRRITWQDGFYTHPVYAPDGTIVVVRSRSEARRSVYLEFGQFRNAELVTLDRQGNPQVIAQGDMGGTPHFLDDGSWLINRPDGVYDVESGEKLVGVSGPNWYFAEGPAQADDIRVSPDGKHALAKIAQQLHWLEMPTHAGEVVHLQRDVAGQRQVSDIGADFFGWRDGDDGFYWSVGPSLYRVNGPTAVPQSVRVSIKLPRAMHRGNYLLRGATVLTMGDAGDIGNADVLVVDDRIAAIGPRGSVRSEAGTAVHDMSGRFIIPGLIDVHDHVADIRRDVLDFAPWGPRANLAYGVTTAFDPSTLSVDMLAYQDAIDAGLTKGSRILSTGPAIFSFNDFRSAAEVDAVLRRYREHYGLTNIKMYRTGNRRVRQWIADAARRLGLQPTTEGALAAKLDLSHVFDGYSGNEHAVPPSVLYDDVVQLMAKSGISYDLTLQITHGGFPAQDYFIARDRPYHDSKYAELAPEFFRRQKFAMRVWRDPSLYLFPTIAASAGRFADAGGLLAIGSHGEVPGLGMHWEMEAHAMGGMAPSEVLRAATIGGARAIGREPDLGSIEAGKIADMVVLKADPRLDIRNSLAISCVIKAGEYCASLP